MSAAARLQAPIFSFRSRHSSFAISGLNTLVLPAAAAWRSLSLSLLLHLSPTLTPLAFALLSVLITTIALSINLFLYC